MTRFPEFKSILFNKRNVAVVSAFAGLLSLAGSVERPMVDITRGEVVARTVNPPHDWVSEQLIFIMNKNACKYVNHETECTDAYKFVSVLEHGAKTYTLTLENCGRAEDGSCLEGNIDVSKQVFEHAALGSTYPPTSVHTS